MKQILEIEVSDENLLKLDSLEEIFLYKVFLEPVFKKKIVITFIEGQSGEGKSMTSLALAEHLEILFHKLTGKNKPYFDPIQQVVYTPREYPAKIDAWTKSPYLTLVVDELRFLVPKEKWSSLLSQSIAEANATLRAVKIAYCKYPGIIIYNSQDIGDVTKSVRKTITYDIKVQRWELVEGRVYVFWTDMSNVEKPVLRPKRLEFSLGDVTFKLNHFKMPLPSKRVEKTFVEVSADAKAKILMKRRERILKEIKRELGEVKDFREELKNDEIFELIKGMASFSKRRGVYFTKTNMLAICKMYDLTKKEFRKQFLPAFIEEAKKRGLI